MKSIQTGFFCLIIQISILASSIVVTSDVTTNTEWNTDTVVIDKEYFEIGENARLTIAPGSYIIFKKDISIITVNGTITANGTEDDSIYISRLNPVNEWQGIRLVPRNKTADELDSSFFTYCNLRNAFSHGSEKDYERQGGALHCGKGNYVTLNHCNISGNSGDIGGAVYLDSGSTMLIERCTFKSNGATFFGGGALMTCESGSSNLKVNNCRFEYNYARNGGAVRVGKGTKAEFNNCVFYRDTTRSINSELGDLKGGALAVFGPAEVTLRGCIIFLCRSYEKGGGIYSADASIKLINCTIAQNTAIYGGGIYFAMDSAASSPLIVNTIEYGNGRISGIKLPCDSAGCGIFLDSLVSPEFRYCHLYDTVYDYTIKSYQGKFTNSMFYKTGFVYRVPGFDYPDTVVEGYQLSSRFSGDDPGIDGGTPDTTGLGLPEFDLLGQKRIYGDAVDIGAIEYNDTFLITEAFSVFRRPSKSGADYDGAEIYSLSGRKVGSFTGVFHSSIIRQVVDTRVSKGMYLVVMHIAGGRRRLEKVLVK